MTYIDAKDIEKTLQADSVVVYGGLKARRDQTLIFYGTAPGLLLSVTVAMRVEICRGAYVMHSLQRPGSDALLRFEIKGY